MGDGPSTGATSDLTPQERAEIDGMYLRLATSNYYELLGVATSADRKALRDAYFGLSQKFHPDVWFGKQLGGWKARIEEIFREITRAYDALSNRNLRKEYDDSIGVRRSAEPAVAPVASPVAPSPSAVVPTPVVPAPQDPNALIIPRRDARPPVTERAPVAQPSAPAVHVDHEAAQRSAREALARKLGRSSNTMPAARPTTGSHPVATTPAPSSALANMKAMQANREEAERQARLTQYLRLCDESLARNDVVGASNALVLAVGIAPGDAALKLRSEEMTLKAAALLAEKYVEQARQLERVEKWAPAADLWQRASVGRPKDSGLLLHAASALLRARTELPRAADLARRAIQISPRSVEAHGLLAQIYLEGGMRASAQAAVDAASKLDPNAAIVKDLQARLRG